MVMPADRVAADRIRVPLESPATPNVTVVVAEEDEDPAGEACRERDVGERPADEVVAPVRGPVDDGMEAGEQHEGERTTLGG